VGTLQLAFDVLGCDGIILQIDWLKPGSPRAGSNVTTAEGTKRLIKREAEFYDRRLRREAMGDRGRKGGKARAARLTKEQLSEIGKLGGYARHGMTPPATEQSTPANTEGITL
jgi:general stress protein YciG